MAKNNGGKALGVGLGLAAAAAAAAGAYYFYGKDGSKNRKALKSWMVKAKGDVMEHVEKLQNVSEQTYTKVVNDVMAKYKKLKTATPAEIAAMTKELKGHWKSIKSELDKASKRVSKTAKKSDK
jgi:hypothetical protein